MSKTKRNLALNQIELLTSVVVLIIAFIVSARLIYNARIISENAIKDNLMLCEARSIAEEFKHSNGDIDTLEQKLAITLDENNHAIIKYDKEAKITDSNRYRYELSISINNTTYNRTSSNYKEIEIVVTDMRTANTVAELEVAAIGESDAGGD